MHDCRRIRELEAELREGGAITEICEACLHPQPVVRSKEVKGSWTRTNGVDCSGLVQQVFARFNIDAKEIAGAATGMLADMASLSHELYPDTRPPVSKNVGTAFGSLLRALESKQVYYLRANPSVVYNLMVAFPHNFWHDPDDLDQVGTMGPITVIQDTSQPEGCWQTEAKTGVILGYGSGVTIEPVGDPNWQIRTDDHGQSYAVTIPSFPVRYGYRFRPSPAVIAGRRDVRPQELHEAFIRALGSRPGSL